MTSEPQQEYIITGEELQFVERCLPFWNLHGRHKIADHIRSRPLTKTSSSITTVNDMDHRKSRLGPGGSTSAPVREESRHVGGNCDGYVIHPKKDCFGRYQGVGDDRCFSCDDWGYCADVTEAARTLLTKTPETNLRVACCAICPCRVPGCEGECKEYLNQKEHDAQVARAATLAENKRLLDAIKEFTRRNGYWWRIREDEQRYHWEPAKFDEFLKSLRIPQEPPK